MSKSSLRATSQSSATLKPGGSSTKSLLSSKSALSTKSQQKANITLFQILRDLLNNYAKHPALTPLEFIEQKLTTDQITEDVGTIFLRLYRHKIFLGNIADMYHQYLLSTNQFNKQQPIKNNEVIVVYYLLIFELNPENWMEIYAHFQNNLEMLNQIMGFFTLEDSTLQIIEEGCRIYDKDYLTEEIISKLVRNEGCVELMMTKTLEDVEKKKQSLRRRVTKSKAPSMMSRRSKTKQKVVVKSATGIPACKTFESRPVPLSTYKQSEEEELLEAERRKNRIAAYELLAEAKKLKLKCAEPKQPPKPVSPKLFKPIPAKPFPKFDPVEVKGTTASLMRQAALLAKEKEAEIKEIESLVAGTIGDMSQEELEEMRRAKEEELMQDIERKHLQGLLTREEAILAKKRLHQMNQVKKQQYQEERIKLLETIDEYRRQEEEKTKLLVEKVQAIENAAKDAEAKLLKERRCNAKLIEYETQILLKQASEEREEELAKKMALIKELKLLQQINAGNNKVEFDPTETKNLGLLCEMSIAELQERLGLLKITMKEELGERKAKILAEKKKQQVMLEQMKEFVETAKVQKCKPEVKVLKKREMETPDDIKLLREKLKVAREQRVQGNKPTSIM